MRSIIILASALFSVVSVTACAKEPAAPATRDEAPAPAPAPAAAPTAAEPAPPPATPDKPTAVAGTIVGQPAPDFTLPDLDGKSVSLSSLRGKVVVLEWFNPGCPFVQRSHTKGSLVDTAKRHTASGVAWIAINSGGPGKQGHDVGDNKKAVASYRMPHPVLRDVDGKIGKAYGATNTPHMFVIDKAGTVVYAGAIDNSPDAEGKSPEGGKLVNHVDQALADLAAGRPVATPSTKAYGCGVKYGS